MKIIITGVAGFIGFNVAQKLINAGHDIIGIDNLDPMVQIKLDRLAQLPINNYQTDITDKNELIKVFDEHKDFSAIIHLAGHADCSASFEDPLKFMHANVIGFQNILEATKEINPQAHLIYASSSAVRGANDGDGPLSPYGVSKMENEMMAKAYGKAYGLKSTGLRFYTVFGPWGRPGMAIYKFTEAFLNGDSVELYNNGENSRDFTYVDDVVRAIELAMHRTNNTLIDVFDIGCGRSISVVEVAKVIEETLGVEGTKILVGARPGEIVSTLAPTAKAKTNLGFTYETDFAEGIKRFVDWYKMYHNDKN